MKNCSCTAYSNLDIRGEGSGCLVWFGNLVDITVMTEGGQDFYVRMAASEIGTILVFQFYIFLDLSGFSFS